MKHDLRTKRRRRIRARVVGTAARPRASVFRSRTAISVQLIDDQQGKTLLAVRSAVGTDKNKTEAAGDVGRQVGEAAVSQGISEVVFDRGGYRYHGRVKAVAEGMRAAGVKL
jgi:large subunit ribosomal protein L18